MAEPRSNAHLLLKKPLHIIMGSIGSDIRYDLETKDITTKGFFIESEHPGRFPFTTSSIVEVWIEIEEGTMIFLNAKIARIVFPDEIRSRDEEAPGFLFRVVQIEPEEEKRLGDFLLKRIEELESAEGASSAESSRKAS